MDGLRRTLYSILPTKEDPVTLGGRDHATKVGLDRRWGPE